jgi:aminopeptidase N
MQMAGFYRSRYTAANGEVRFMGSTQFEALDARRAFCCWDEPSVKAVFSVTMVVPADRTAFSNMPELESTLTANGKKLIKFADSPVMST